MFARLKFSQSAEWVRGDFACLWLGQTVSWFGDSFFLLAMLWLVLDLTGSRAMLGIVAAARTLPSLLGVASGVLVDRWDRRRTMLVSDILRALIVATVPALSWLGMLATWQLPIIAFALGVVSIVFDPARQVIMPELLSDRALVSANALMSVSRQLAGAIGFALGGIALAALGTQPLFLVDAATFLVSALLLWRMRHVSTAAKRDGSASGFIEDASRGLRFIASDPALVRILPLILGMNLVVVPLFVLMPGWVSDVLRQGPRTFGFIETAQLLGMLAGSLGAFVSGDRGQRAGFVFGALLIQGLSLVAFSQSRNVAASLSSLFVFGATDALVMITFTAYLQRTIPAEIRGKVFGVVEAVTQALTPAGQALGGLLGAYLPLPGIYGGVAGLRLAGTALLWLSRPVRQALDNDARSGPARA